MKLSINIYISLSFLCYVIIIVLKIIEYETIAAYLIPFFVLLVFIATIIFNRPLVKNRLLLYLAFGFVCVGDFLVNLTSYGKYSVLSFCGTHICLIIYYLKDTHFKKSDLNCLFLPFGISAMLFLFIKRDIAEVYLSVVFAVYLIVLSTMLWRAICYIKSNYTLLRKVLIIAGSSFFYITDICVSSNVVYHTKTLMILTWICYPPALAMLSLINIKQTRPVQQG
jgi:hypothetical protein